MALTGADNPPQQFATKTEVREMCDGLRGDMNTGFSKILERMDEQRKLTQSSRTPPISRKMKSGKKISTTPMRRDASKIRNAVSLMPSYQPRKFTIRSEIVRQHLTALVGQNRLYTPLVTEEESIAFGNLWIASGGDPAQPCCTADAFRFDILGTPKNHWNTSVARVFYQSLVPEAERSSVKFKEITEAFHTRVKSLKQESKAKRDAAELNSGRRDARRLARKHYVRRRWERCVPISDPYHSSSFNDGWKLL
jgi:hypothetical protein